MRRHVDRQRFLGVGEDFSTARALHGTPQRRCAAPVQITAQSVGLGD